MSEVSPLQGFKETDVSAQEVNNRIIQWSPLLDKLNKADQTMSEYFAPLAKWESKNVFPLQGKAFDLIQEHAARLYGDDTAKKLRSQLEQHPVAETGTHISFPRDYDFQNGVTYDNELVWQGALLSSSLYRNAGMNVHFGLYSSRIPVANTNSAEFLQVASGGHLTRVVTSKKAKSTVMHAPIIDAQKINEIRAESQNFFIQQQAGQAKKLIQQAWDMDSERRDTWSQFLNKTIVHTAKNEYTMNKIKDDLALDGLVLPDYKLRVEFANELLDGLAQPLARSGQSFGFSDQVMAVQTRVMNKMMPQDIQQVTVDFAAISTRLMADAFRDENSLLHQIFADDAKRDAFVQQMSGIRTGWDVDPQTGRMQAPFLMVSKVKDSIRLNKIDYESNKDLFTPEQIAVNLENGRIAPTTALEVGFMLMETGIAVHGGMFQAIYAPDIQNRFVEFLHGNGDHKRAQALADMPLDVALQSPCFGITEEYGQTRLLRVSDFLDNGITIAEAEQLGDLKSRHALGIASPTLHNFFTYYETNLTENIREIVSPKAAQDIYDVFRHDANLVKRSIH